jgi:Cft2 family RNA processing exonuclease
MLLSHPTIMHMGAVPFLELECPIYATIPTIELGRLTIEDAVLCAHDADRLKETSIAKVRSKMDRIRPMRYMQTLVLQDGKSTSA